MTDAQNHCAELIVALAVCTVFLTLLLSAKPVEAYSGITTEGDIRICTESGQSELTIIRFPLFTAGRPDKQDEWFIVRNVAEQPVYVSWSISSSSILWSPVASGSQSGYDHDEGGVQKYTFRILQHDQGKVMCLAPEQAILVLKERESVKLCFELAYSGSPTTAETFTMTVTFHAAEGE
jgi:hypothetical protein